MSTQDLTHAEAAEAFEAFAKTIGPQATVIVGLNTRPWCSAKPLHVSIYPQGVGKDRALGVDADTYAELLAQTALQWAAHGDTHAQHTIREMALQIISITADEGSCSELSLCRTYAPAEVKTYGDRACEEASRIAGNGPFSILRAGAIVQAA